MPATERASSSRRRGHVCSDGDYWVPAFAGMTVGMWMHPLLPASESAPGYHLLPSLRPLLRGEGFALAPQDEVEGVAGGPARAPARGGSAEGGGRGGPPPPARSPARAPRPPLRPLCRVLTAL